MQSWGGSRGVDEFAWRSLGRIHLVNDFALFVLMVAEVGDRRKERPLVL